MAHIPDQLIKINSNILEAEGILSDLKNRTKTENVAEQIEHFESMLNKLNSLKKSYLQLSAQFEASRDMKNSLVCVTSVLQNNNQSSGNYEGVDGVPPNTTGSVFDARNSLSSDDQLDRLRKERDRLKKELQDKQSKNLDCGRTSSLNVDVTNTVRPFNSPNSFSDLVSDLDNFTGLDISFYISILNHHIDIGTKMLDMVDGLSLSDNLVQGIGLLKEVMQRLFELRDRFQSAQSTRENIENQGSVDEDVLKQEMETFNKIFGDLKENFATGVKCFKSTMDIIQSYLDPGSVQVSGDRVASNDGATSFSNGISGTVSNGSAILPGEEITIVNSKNNNNNSESASEDNNNRSNEEEEDDNNDGGDEDSNDSCREKDQDESMEIGVGSSAVDSMNERTDQEAMHDLRLQTEFEQKEILRLLEEKRIMQRKLADLKRAYSAKEVAKSQAISLPLDRNMFDDYSHFLQSSQGNDAHDNVELVPSNTQRPDFLALRTGSMVNEMGSLLQMLSDIKNEVPYGDTYQSSSSKLSKSNTPKDQSNTSMRLPFNCNSFSSPVNLLLPELNEKTEELRQKQKQIKKLQDMLDQIKNDSLILNESVIIHESNDVFNADHNNEPELNNIGRSCKSRDSVTFQEPVATFIANEELYENMREVRMRREELRDRSARNSNSDPRSPSARMLDSGNAPGAPPDAPTIMPVTSHETSSQDRTTAATWGSSSAGGDDYEDHSAVDGSTDHNQLNRENLRIRSEGTGVSPLTTLTTTMATDERSRVAPVGQSSTFRSKIRDSSSYIKNVIDSDFNNLEGQLENIVSLCRNMALEQNRLARDVADLKCASSPRLTSNGPDLVINSSCAVSKQQGLLTDDNLQNWVSSNSSIARNGATMTTSTTADSNIRVSQCNSHMDTSWEEASIASSTAIQNQYQQHLQLLQLQQHQQQQLQQRQSSATWYYQPMTGCQNVMQQQTMLLQNHAMFMKLQMSLIASQLEQQRLCNLALQQQQNYVSNAHSVWPVRGLTPSYYPPPGPLLPMLPPVSSTITSDHHHHPSLIAPPPPLNFTDLDYPGLYPPDNNRCLDNGPPPGSAISNHHPTAPSAVNSWKTPPMPSLTRHVTRN